MKSLILYGSPTKLTSAHHPVRPVSCDYYVRAVVYNGDFKEAMEHTKTMDGEVVLNTVPIGSQECDV